MATILIVDDRPSNRAFLNALLGYTGHRLLEAEDGAQALAVARAQRPDLIITDINMPKMDGISLIREARKLLRFTPILALTTESQQGKRDEAKKCGATGWLVKPVGGADLVKIIKQVLPGA